MWNYEKRLQYPVKITQTNPKIAQIIISQFGGPDGELAASMRYLSQRYTMPYKEVTGTLTDIGTEELAHMEMICAIVYQLTKDLTPEEYLRQHPASRKGPGSLRSDPLPQRPRDRTLPAVRGEPAHRPGKTGQQKLLCFQSGI